MHLFSYYLLFFCFTKLLSPRAVTYFSKVGPRLSRITRSESGDQACESQGQGRQSQRKNRKLIIGLCCSQYQEPVTLPYKEWDGGCICLITGICCMKNHAWRASLGSKCAMLRNQHDCSRYIATVPKFNLIPWLPAVRRDCISANKDVTLHRSHAHPRDIRFSLQQIHLSRQAEITASRRRVEFQHFWSKDHVRLYLSCWAAQTFVNTCCSENSLPNFLKFYFKSLGLVFQEGRSQLFI